jgi:hypothetical protein
MTKEDLWQQVHDAREKVSQRHEEDGDLLRLLRNVERMAMDAEEALERATKHQPAFQIMRLGQLIAVLKGCKLAERGRECCVRLDYPACLTGSVDSYRGYYEDLALGYDWSEEKAEPTIAKLLETLEWANGSTYSGWKGGEFKMHEDTRLWIDNSGTCFGVAIVGAEVDSIGDVRLHTWLM